jgi:tRNA-specific 2-thiouridylase
VNQKETYAVAMSGGVDSSVAAARLVEQGHNVFGLMLRLWAAPGLTNRCCSPSDVERARRVARLLDIPFYVLDMQEPFREVVVSVFVSGYAQGITPNPCIACNRTIRWGHLLQAAQSMGASRLATGHYARLEGDARRPILRRGVDPQKDQSYVLAMLTPAQLSFAAFPIGGMTKPQVRELAKRKAFDVADRPDSQDLCFLGGRDYRGVLRALDGGTFRPGPIVDGSGRLLGEHHGLADYTIGQRKGLGIAGPEPLYVLAKDTSQNTLVVGPKSALGRTEFRAVEVNWVSGSPPMGRLRADAQVRYRAPARPATVEPVSADAVDVRLDGPAPDVTPGQYAVFYDGDRCLGGGMIAR